MSGFLGSYLYQVDEKGRVTLPAPFRRGADADSFVLIQAHPDALTLYPEDSWEDVQGRIRELMRRAPRARHYLLGLTANAVHVVPDKQGRILVPERLRESVGIGSEARLIGAIDRIELWDPARFERAVGDADEDLRDLAAGIFV